MKSSSFIFTLFIIGSITSDTTSNTDKCSGRWRIIDNLNIRITLDWQFIPLTDIFVSEFRTNLVEKGFWYAFGFSTSPNKPEEVEIVYALRWRENDTQLFWDIYNVTKSNVTILKNNVSSLVTFQRSLSSGLLTVRPTDNLTSFITGKQCLYFVYMRGRFAGDTPLTPDEIRFNQSLCLTCQRFELTSTIENRISQSLQDFTTENFRHTSILTSSRTEFNFFWLGRIINRPWLNDYSNLRSTSSQILRLDLQNLFLSLINHIPSYSFICNQFELYSLQSGSILFANNITLISNLSNDQTLNTIENLIKTVNSSTDSKLNFDLSSHRIIRATETSRIPILRTVDGDLSKQAEINSAVRLLIGGMVSLTSLMIFITTILCLYGYYKCRRRQFRLLTERQPIQFKYDINSYSWLGQQPSLSSSSSPYLIQSTSI